LEIFIHGTRPDHFLSRLPASVLRTFAAFVDVTVYDDEEKGGGTPLPLFFDPPRGSFGREIHHRTDNL
jgi:hypothetical protein